MPLLPEHAKVQEIQPLSQAIYDFLEWCQEQGMSLGSYGTSKYHEHTFYPINESREALLARHFGIDLGKLENEKREILKGCRG